MHIDNGPSQFPKPNATRHLKADALNNNVILEWTQLVCTPAPGILFVIHSLTSNVHVTSQSNTDLRYYVIRDAIVI